MRITAILCTYNRSGILAQALESIAGSTLPFSEDWEVLVVDNNSSDQTRAVVEQFGGRYPGRFRYLFEPQQGLSHARNAGVREARGDILAFVDDDVTVAPGWLEHLTAPLGNGKCAGAGGRVLPKWTAPAPDWLPVKERYGLAPFAVFDLGPEAGVLGEPPFGANMAFQKTMFARYGNFRTDLGRCGTALLSNEDTEFGQRLLNAGETLRYEPAAVVYHPVSEERLQKSYLLRWWFGKSRADMREFGPRPGTRYFFRGVPLYLFRSFTGCLLRWTVSREASRRFQEKIKVWSNMGQIAECYQKARTARLVRK